jgi:hypothetical protein
MMGWVIWQYKDMKRMVLRALQITPPTATGDVQEKAHFRTNTGEVLPPSNRFVPAACDGSQSCVVRAPIGFLPGEP